MEKNHAGVATLTESKRLLKIGSLELWSNVEQKTKKLFYRLKSKK